MSLNNNALTSLENAKLFLGLEGDKDNDLLEALINRSSYMIENLYVNRPLINIATSSSTTLLSSTEYFDGGYDSIYVKYYPIGTITSVYSDPDRTYTDTDDAVDSTSYVLYEERGEIRFDSTPTVATHSVRVIYTGGYTTATLPIEIEQACIELTGLLYKQKDSLGISGKSYSDGSVSYYENRLSWLSKDILFSHRRFNV